MVVVFLCNVLGETGIVVPSTAKGVAAAARTEARGTAASGDPDRDTKGTGLFAGAISSAEPTPARGGALEMSATGTPGESVGPLCLIDGAIAPSCPGDFFAEFDGVVAVFIPNF